MGFLLIPGGVMFYLYCPLRNSCSGNLLKMGLFGLLMMVFLVVSIVLLNHDSKVSQKGRKRTLASTSIAISAIVLLLILTLSADNGRFWTYRIAEGRTYTGYGYVRTIRFYADGAFVLHNVTEWSNCRYVSSYHLEGNTLTIDKTALGYQGDELDDTYELFSDGDAQELFPANDSLTMIYISQGFLE